MAFTQDYELPQKENNYVKLQPGDNKFRIMSDIITWFVDWKDRKPLRSKEEQKPVDPTRLPKHFWAMAVWDYQANKIKVMEITQSGIQKSLWSYQALPERGDLKNYDITITKSGSGMDTKYTTVALPPKEIGGLIQKAYELAKINLNALYEWKDPFEGMF